MELGVSVGGYVLGLPGLEGFSVRRNCECLFAGEIREVCVGSLERSGGLPRKRVEYELSCPDCGHVRTKIGEEVSE